MKKKITVLKNFLKILSNNYLLLIFTFISFYNFIYLIAFGWPRFDDYFSIGLMGNGDNFYERGINATHALYDSQSRLQPFRHLVWSFFLTFFQEENIQVVHVLIHIFNLALLSKFLRNFNFSDKDIYLFSSMFTLFSIERLLEMSVVSIGGIVICTSFLLISLIFFQRYLTSSKLIELMASTLFYSFFVFSYEIAIPMILIFPLIYFLYSNEKHILNFNHFFNSIKKSLIFLIPVIIYLFFYLSKIDSGNTYTGATINFSYFATKIIAYFKYTLVPIRSFTFSTLVLVNFFIFFVIWQIIISKMKKNHRKSNDNYSKFFIFSLIFYFLSISLYTINNWLTPTSVMNHHSYLMTLGSSLVLISLLNLLCKVKLFKHSTLKLLIFSFLVPYLFALMVFNNHQYYKSKNDDYIFRSNLKSFVMNEFDLQNEHAKNLIFLNMPENSLGFSDWSAALFYWSNFKYQFKTGNDIENIDFNKKTITFKNPMSYYQHIRESYTTSLDKVEFIFVDYHEDNDKKTRFKKIENFINIDENSYQLLNFNFIADADNDDNHENNNFSQITTASNITYNGFIIKNNREKRHLKIIYNGQSSCYNSVIINDKNINSLNLKNNEYSKYFIIPENLPSYIFVNLNNKNNTCELKYVEFLNL